uniref:Retrovirus-related Pol polyprotein from transposon TNT 1-94 n=1 Tax=Tanacetum cinerariifolium TaxID=118510 RepID=A0A6L2NG95_TANCI|nr:retrovirus-related Pol polyprotein from transposon TNT 1-94 [Tanacetum cinerariifolium]
MREKGINTWDGAQTHMVLLGECFGTVQLGFQGLARTVPWVCWSWQLGLRFKGLKGGQVRSLGFSYNRKNHAMSDKSSPLKRLIIGINVWVKLSEGENIFSMLWIFMQVTLFLSTAWRESHASDYDRVVLKRKYLRPSWHGRKMRRESKAEHRGRRSLKELIEDLALYNNESWNDPKDFTKPVKAITLPQDVPSTSNRCLVELENQVQRLIKAYIPPKPSVQVIKITFSCEIYGGPHGIQYCMENPRQAFVDYASSCNDKTEDDTKSHSGYVFVLNSGAVDRKSANQSTIAMASTKAKYIVASEASMKAVLMRTFIDGLEDVMPSNKRPMEMLCDNAPAIKITNDLGIMKGAKHYPRKISLHS